MIAALITIALAATPPRVIAAFENQSGDVQLEPLRQGLADLVLTDLVGTPGITVLERARLNEMLKELNLQHTEAFDPSQAARIGKMLGATHAIAGALVAVAPKVRLVVRVIALPKGEVITRAQVEGDAADLFALETELAKRLINAMNVTFDEAHGQHASLQAVTAWSQGVALSEAGQLDAAKSKLAEAVRLSPDFEIAESEYRAVMQRLRASQDKRGALFEQRTIELKARLVGQLGDPAHRLAARIALTNLALVELSRKSKARPDAATYWPRTEPTPVELEFIDHATRLIDALRAHPDENRELDAETKRLADQATELDLANWDFSPSPATLSIDLGHYFGSGWTPKASEVPAYALRPAPSQLAPKYLEEAKKWFARADAELAKEPKNERHAFNLASARAEMAVLHGRRVEAVAHWQGFLDAYPEGEDFKDVSAKIEAVMALDDESEADTRAVKSCDVAMLSTRGAALATRWWRSKGVAGLETLAATLAKCGQKQLGFTVVGNELVRIADCDAFARVKTRAAEQGVRLGTCGP